MMKLRHGAGKGSGKGAGKGADRCRVGYPSHPLIRAASAARLMP